MRFGNGRRSDVKGRLQPNSRSSTAKWAASPALFPSGREFDPSEPSSQAANIRRDRPEAKLSPKMQAEAERERLKGGVASTSTFSDC